MESSSPFMWVYVSTATAPHGREAPCPLADVVTEGLKVQGKVAMSPPLGHSEG